MKENKSTETLIKIRIILSSIIAILVLLCIFLEISKNNSESLQEADQKIEFVAKVKKLYIGPNMGVSHYAAVSNSIYILDYDGHVFGFYFNPELLLLEDGSYIKLFISKEYYDDTFIKIMNDSYEIGNVSESDYLNKWYYY